MASRNHPGLLLVDWVICTLSASYHPLSTSRSQPRILSPHSSGRALPLLSKHSNQNRSSPQPIATGMLSESESDEEFSKKLRQKNQSERLQFLTATGLVQKQAPSHSRSHQPPSARRPATASSPSACHLLASPRSPTIFESLKDSHPKNDLSPLVIDGDYGLELGLSRLQAAFKNYSPNNSTSTDTPIQPIHSSASSHPRRPAKSLSGRRPSLDSLKSPTIASRPQSAVLKSPNSIFAPSLPNTGFRTWLASAPRPMGAMPSSGLDSRATEDKQRFSLGSLFTLDNAPLRHTRLSHISSTFLKNNSSSRRSSIAAGALSISPLILRSDGTPPSGNLTWLSFVGNDKAANVSLQERNRQETIFELIQTEAVFVQNCQLLIQIFYSQLLPIIGIKAALVIFANIEEIMLFGTTFLSALEERQQQCQFHVQSIGDVISNYITGIDIYRPYCTNQSNATRMLNDLKRLPAVSSCLSGLKVNGLELEHYLLQPMQRLTRYPLLLSQIIKYTDENSLDHKQLCAALKTAQSVLTDTNEAIRNQERDSVLTTLSEQLTIPGSDAKLNLVTMTRLVGPRRLIREGSVTKSISRKTLNAYLFNDFFLLTKPSRPASSGFLEHNSTKRRRQQVMYRAPMALEDCQFRVSKDDHIFIVQHESETFYLKVPEGPKACAAWVADMKQARQAVFDALTSLKPYRATWAFSGHNPQPGSSAITQATPAPLRLPGRMNMRRQINSAPITHSDLNSIHCPARTSINESTPQPSRMSISSIRLNM
ncbi:hypothetical protein O181_032236 [Austropuccinia psidii MF-1]|uniref:DH domain-containing protein n=1 Tax=Austropuccinia psidii MF-1 TaxID=1389203 RepID=A0A9Q3H5Y7_9BASI|nr:hypothetical protein [Austropuccinia psidii MF-1]